MPLSYRAQLPMAPVGPLGDPYPTPVTTPSRAPAPAERMLRLGAQYPRATLPDPMTRPSPGELSGRLNSSVVPHWPQTTGMVNLSDYGAIPMTPTIVPPQIRSSFYQPFLARHVDVDLNLNWYWRYLFNTGISFVIGQKAATPQQQPGGSLATTRPFWSKVFNYPRYSTLPDAINVRGGP